MACLRCWECAVKPLSPVNSRCNFGEENYYPSDRDFSIHSAGWGAQSDFKWLRVGDLTWVGQGLSQGVLSNL